MSVDISPTSTSSPSLSLSEWAACIQRGLPRCRDRQEEWIQVWRERQIGAQRQAGSADVAYNNRAPPETELGDRRQCSDLHRLQACLPLTWNLPTPQSSCRCFAMTYPHTDTDATTHRHKDRRCSDLHMTTSLFLSGRSCLPYGYYTWPDALTL